MLLVGFSLVTDLVFTRPSLGWLKLSLSPKKFIIHSTSPADSS